MPAHKENKQSVVLAVLLFLIAAVVLWYYMPGFALDPLKGELDKANADARGTLDLITRTQRDLAKEKSDQEELNKEQQRLARVWQQIVERDPDIWFMGNLSQDASGRIFLTSWSKGVEEALPEGMKLPRCQLYRPKVEAKGSFNELGDFIAFVENKYPHLFLKSISIRGQSAEDDRCEASLVFGILTKKSAP
jgi:hypothetical protein